MTQIVLTRHGHVDWITPERFRGRADLPLTNQGLAQARAVSARIRSSWAVAAVYTSPMSRCLRTGQIIAEPLGLEALPMDAFNDIDYGEWQGLTPDEARVCWPAEVDLWYRRPDLARIASGEGLHDVLARVVRGLRALVDHHPTETLVLVAHDGVNRVILLHALDLALSRYWHLAQAPCAINRIEATSDGFRVRSINETGHLQGLQSARGPAGGDAESAADRAGRGPRQTSSTT
jgi:broad specificity phosphatase PhoE